MFSVVNSDCSPNQACRDYKCVSVCANQCGINADCISRNHVPVCSCPPHYTGDPFVHCRRVDPGKYEIEMYTYFKTLYDQFFTFQTLQQRNYVILVHVEQTPDAKLLTMYQYVLVFRAI